ncbi:hypothetical protein [Streptomyces virginiae]|uniref:hypothetical protein n=1 Tax=Streptomyces virginiae TaxID=1961 RepID=UPI00364C8219
MKSEHWRVDDLCSIGRNDAKHLDLYIGEQTRAGFESEDFYFATKNATVQTSMPGAGRALATTRRLSASMGAQGGTWKRAHPLLYNAGSQWLSDTAEPSARGRMAGWS